MYIDQYSDKLKKHFLEPHNMGKIEPEDLAEGEFLATGTVGNPKCGDLMKVYLRISDNTIKDIKVETFGCGSAIACSSVTTDMAMGKSLSEAKQISKKDAADALGGLPPVKMHCSNLAADALHVAIANFEKGKNVFDCNGTVDKLAAQADNCEDNNLSSTITDNKGSAMESDDQSQPADNQPAAEDAEQPITKDMMLGDVIEKYPQAAQVLMEHGLHCIGCRISAMETVEQGAQAHGLDDEAISSMVEKMNQSIEA